MAFGSEGAGSEESVVGGGGEGSVPYGYRTPVLGLALAFSTAPFSFGITPLNFLLRLREIALHLQTKALVGAGGTVLGVKLSIANRGLGSAVINSARGSSQLSLRSFVGLFARSLVRSLALLFLPFFLNVGILTCKSKLGRGRKRRKTAVQVSV